MGQRTKAVYTIVDPNTPREVRKLLKMLIVQKLPAGRAGGGP